MYVCVRPLVAASERHAARFTVRIVRPQFTKKGGGFKCKICEFSFNHSPRARLSTGASLRVAYTWSGEDRQRREPHGCVRAVWRRAGTLDTAVVGVCAVITDK